jgi:hypothetical protein
MRTPEQLHSIAEEFGDRSEEAFKLLQTYDGFAKESHENIRLNAMFRSVAFAVAVVVGCVQHRQNVDMSTIIATQTAMICTSIGGTWMLSRIGKSIRQDLYSVVANLELLIPKDRQLTARAALEDADIHGESREKQGGNTSSYIRTAAQEIGEKLAPYLTAFFG